MGRQVHTAVHVLTVLAMMSFLLSGCSSTPDGLVGVTLDDSGQVLGVARTCQHRLDGVTLQPADPPTEANTDDVAIGNWTFKVDTSRQTASWPLVGHSQTSVRTTKVARSLPTASLSMFGWTRDGSFGAESVSFDKGDLVVCRANRR
jgi:hypothetical protein